MSMFNLEHKVDIVLRYIASDEPADRAALQKIAAQALMCSPNPENPACVRDLIVNALNNIGVPRHLKGYNYCIRAIELYIENPDYRNCIHKGLYYDLANEYDTTGSRVERGIRTAIEASFSRMDDRDIARIYGGTVPPNKGKLTNTEFLAFWSVEISRQAKLYNFEI